MQNIERALRNFLMDENYFDNCLYDLTEEYNNTCEILRDGNGLRVDAILINADDELYFWSRFGYKGSRGYHRPTRKDLELAAEFINGISDGLLYNYDGEAWNPEA